MTIDVWRGAKTGQIDPYFKPELFIFVLEENAKLFQSKFSFFTFVNRGELE